MENEIITFSPILVFIAILLTIMASYTAIDLFSLLKSSDRNDRFLFLGGTASMGIGIWIMNYFGMLAVEGYGGPTTSNFSLSILSMVLGISFTGVAFYAVTNKVVRNKNILIGAFFLTVAVLSIHVIGMHSRGMAIKYQPVIFNISLIMIFISFYFALWMLYNSKSLVNRYQVWIKPISAVIMTGSIVEGFFLLTKAAVYQSRVTTVLPDQNMENFLVYLVLFVSILIFAGLVWSSALVTNRLAKSDTYLNDITDALNESSIVAITDPKGTITYVNDKFCEISKYSEEELVGENHNILNSGYHSKEFFKEMWRTIGQGSVWKGEMKNLAKDGSFYWVHTTIVPFLNKKGKPYQYVSIRTDVTQQKVAEEQLKDSLKEISDINFALDQSSIVAVTDEKGIIKSVNDKFCEISKFEREELIGQDHRMLNSRYHSKEFFKDFWQTIGQGNVWKGEIKNKAKDGSFYWVDTTIVPFLKENGKPYQYLAIRNDITERKRTEEILHRQDKLAAVGQLAAGIAHEIRNPLTSMRGYAEFLQLDESNPERLEFLDIILDEIERVNLIVEEFLVLAKPKIVRLENKNIVPIINNVLSLVEFEARKRNVRLNLDCHESVIEVKCDENRIKQVFLNFIKNAIEAMPEGGDISLKVYLKNENVHVEIQDNGVGIPEEQLKKLGEPFHTTKKNGNGLGLMVSFKIIESHQGRIFVESEVNKGTTFNILLPTQSSAS